MAGIYRRGKVYWARAQRDGREYRRSLKTADRRLAEERFRRWLDELDATSWGDRPRRTFTATAERFIREHLTSVKPTTAKRYGVSLKNLAMHFGTMTLDQITTAALSEFETARRSEGVTAATIRRDFTCLSSMLTSAIDWDWIDANPVLIYVRRRAKRGLKEAPPRTRYLTEAEEASLLQAASPAVAQAIVLAIETGLRRDELFGLEWPQIDLTRNVINTTTRTKSGRARSVPLTARARSIVGTLPRYLDSPYLLVNPATRTRYTHQNNGLKSAMRRAGVKGLCWHDLRRTAGCRWLQRDGLSMEQVSRLLGHTSVKVTEQRYAFLDGEALAEEIAGRTFSGTGAAVMTANFKRGQ